VNLRKLSMFSCNYSWKSIENKVNRPRFAWFPWYKQRPLILTNLQKLKHLDDLYVSVELESHLQALVDNPILWEATRSIELRSMDFDDEDMKVETSKFSKLETLGIRDCSNLRGIQFFGAQ
jgi:hypothetical protein